MPTDHVNISAEAVLALLSPPASNNDKGPTAEQLFTIEPDNIQQAQLTLLQQRFSTLSTKIPELNKLAALNHIDAIHTINDIVPLLFPHTLYKSYPLSLIDNSRFSHLTAWLNDFTSHDLSGLDVSSCQSLDEWLDVIEANTPVRVMTSSGTSGKVSLLPRSTVENDRVQAGFSVAYSPFKQEAGLNDAFADDVYFVFPFPRHARNGTGLVINSTVERFGGNERHALTLGGTISTDLLWMTGRMKKAQAEGSMEQLKTTKAWQRLSSQLNDLEAQKSGSLDDFFKHILTELKGKTVVMMFGLTYYSALVDCAEKHGLDISFAPNSLLTLGGGLKGASISDEQKHKVLTTLFPDQVNDLYGMSESLGTGTTRICAQGHFHPPPLIVPFVLDPDTGIPYPREGLKTGRYAVFDLWAETYWGGFVTGDEVTMNWDGGCACGRTGPYFHNDVGRYSEKRGGDDKITCQRTAAAVEEMMQHLNSKN